jgi:hypothetical protein
MKLVRKVHFWLGTFFAPSIIFFALSGTLQVCGLHEGPGASAVATRLAQIHKSQTLAMPQRRPRPTPPPLANATIAAPPRDAGSGAAPSGEHGPSTPLQAFFVLMSISLIVSSGLGVYMAFQYKRDRRVIVGLLVAGVVLPIAFLWM